MLNSKEVVMGQGLYSVMLCVQPDPNNADYIFVFIRARAVDEDSAALLFPARIGGSTISVRSQFRSVKRLFIAGTSISESGRGLGFQSVKRDALPLFADKDGLVTIEASIQIRPPVVIDLS